ncbi:unnamed protein product, partial [Laminaria digitata]
VHLVLVSTSVGKSKDRLGNCSILKLKGVVQTFRKKRILKKQKKNETAGTVPKEPMIGFLFEIIRTIIREKNEKPTRSYSTPIRRPTRSLPARHHGRPARHV